MTDWIAQLGAHVGIGAAYRSFDGESVSVKPETRLALLRAMNFAVETAADAHDLLSELQERHAARPAPTEVVVPAGQACELALSKPAEWRIEAEADATILASGVAEAVIPLAGLPLGIHRLVLTTGSAEWTTWVLARPHRAASLKDVTGDDKAWGVTAPVYGLTNKGAARLGTYDLLADYATEIARHGADFFGVNPVHAMGQARPDDVISPYSPSHREFLNPWHISKTHAAECEGSSDLIDYPTAIAAGQRALSEEFETFDDTPDFKRFVTAGGASLETYAQFEVLAEQFGADWQTWPAAYKAREAEALTVFSLANQKAIRFHKWSQWRADCSLARAQERARAAGMRVGLYLDLAVGPRIGGAETWDAGSPLTTGASLGAPADALAPAGQRWGLAPMSPHLCREQGFKGFARLLRKVMRHAGMIRIDHILGLMRSYWIPEGAEQGAYVSYPFDALLAVVAIESVRNNVVVIGEDLGLVPEGLREKLAASGIYGLDVMQYMRAPSGGFEDMGQSRRIAACAFATHDTPTVEGFFAAADAKTQQSLGAIGSDAVAEIIRDREAARATLQGQPVVQEVHSRLAQANSEIVAVQLDDIAHRHSQQNLPGTVDEYPNWRQTAPFALNEIQSSPSFASLGAVMCANGRTNSTRTGDGQ